MKWIDYEVKNKKLNKPPLIFRVSFFPSRQAFLRYLRTKTNKGVTMSGRGTAAMFIIYKKPWLNDIFSEVLLYRDYAVEEDVAHELCHLAIAVMKEWNINVNTKEGEEEFATMLGENFGRVMSWVENQKEALKELL